VPVSFRLAASMGALLAALVGLAGPGSPDEEVDLVAARNGARVIKYTSERGGDWRAEMLIADETGPTGWASADASMPQEIVFRLPAGSRFNTLVFSAGSDAPDGQWARDVSVYTADPFPTMGGWKLVARVALSRTAADQVFSVPAVDGRFIRLLITSAQSPDAPRVSLRRFKVFLR
jgi:hypothetical protein